VKAAIVYNLRDKGTAPDSMEDNFGLVGRDFAPKAGYFAPRSALTGRPAGARRRLAHGGRGPRLRRSADTAPAANAAAVHADR
jgi:hypothetical protein